MSLLLLLLVAAGWAGTAAFAVVTWPRRPRPVAPPAPLMPPPASPVVPDHPEHLAAALTLLGKAIDALAAPFTNPTFAGGIPAASALNPANLDWDPTDNAPWLSDPEFGAIAPDRPQVGDAPDLASNPFGVPGLSWPPKPGDVVS